jgi:hypothetical protein
VSKLRAVTILQKKFATAHADKGFACELPLLRPADSEQNPTDYDPLLFLATGTSVGYNLLLANCHTDDKGVVVHYLEMMYAKFGLNFFWSIFRLRDELDTSCVPVPLFGSMVLLGWSGLQIS